MGDEIMGRGMNDNIGNGDSEVRRARLKARKKYLVVGILESIFTNDI
jgi:hypothetical protein